MPRLRYGLIALAALSLVWALGSGAAAGRTTYHLVCATYSPVMDNVPRGSQIAAPNALCIARDNSNGRLRAYDEIRPPHRIQLAARLHVQLTANGRTLANSREYVVPHAPVTILTRWARPHHGNLCAVLWNHDGLGYYRVERVCHRF